MPLVSDEAIVLRRFEFGETSRIVHLLTRSKGRIAVLAKGAHREKSPFLGALDLLNRLGVVYSHRQGRELQILTEVEVLDAHPGLRGDLPRFAAALYASELVGEAAREEDPQTPLYDLFAESLAALAAETGDPATILLVFELAFLNIIGLGPSFDACRGCGGALPKSGSAALAPGGGGAVCEACAPHARVVGRIPAGTLRAAGRLGRFRPSEARRVRVDARLGRGLRRLMDLYLDYHFERPPRSRRYLVIGGRRKGA